MAGTTDTQSLRFGQVTDVISHTMQANLADDIAVQLDAADVARAATLKGPVAGASRGSMNLPVGVAQLVTFTSEMFDTHGMIDIATQPTRLTVPSSAVAGIFEVHFEALWDTTGWTRGDIYFYKNGGFYSQRTWYAPQSLGTVRFTSQVWLGASGDYLQVYVSHEGGGTTANISSTLTAYKRTGN